MSFDLDIIVSAVKAAFANPTANLVTTLIVAASFLIVMLILVVGLLFVSTPKRRKVVKVRRYRRAEAPEGSESPESEQPSQEPEEQPAEEPAGADAEESDGADEEQPAESGDAASAPAVVRVAEMVLASGVILPLLVVAALVAGYVVTGTDAMCAGTCHASQPSVQAAAKVGHAACVACHEEPGFSGIVPNTIARSRMVFARVTGGETGGTTVVDSRPCESCHVGDIGSTVESERGIRMSHAEPSTAGITCVSCHAMTGHSERRDYSMSDCISCHGGRSASTACGTCHISDPYDGGARQAGSGESSATMGSGAVTYPVVQVGFLGCGGCHDEVRECDSCHGLRMPHSEEFIKRGHAKPAAWERKAQCFEKCHEPSWCSSGCHMSFTDAHTPAWKEEHKAAPRNSGCVCHQQRSGRTEPMCVLCHNY